MTVELATAYVSIVPTTKGMQAALTQQINGPASAAGAAGGSKFGGAFVKGGLAVMAGAALFKTVSSFVDSASNLQESVNALNVVYGENAKALEEIGSAAADNLGLSQTEFNELAVQFSAFAKVIGGEGEDVVNTIDDISTRAADFASVMNIDVAEAARLFQSGLAGETEPLRRYGIDMSAATVSTYAYANGIAEAGTQLTEQEKVLARYGLLMEQTSQTQGDFANTSDSFANQQRRMAATWENLKAQLGEVFLPIFEKVMTKVSEGITWVSNNWDTIMEKLEPVGEILAAAWSVIAWSFENIVLPVADAVLDAISAVVKAITNLYRQAVKIMEGIDATFASIDAKIPALKNEALADAARAVSGSDDAAVWRAYIGGDVPGLATGAIVTDPTLAMIGEGGQPEAVIPLDRLEQMLGGDSLGGSPTFNIYNPEPHAAARAVMSEFAFAQAV